jgi:hypothetical protein
VGCVEMLLGHCFWRSPAVVGHGTWLIGHGIEVATTALTTPRSLSLKVGRESAGQQDDLAEQLGECSRLLVRWCCGHAHCWRAR